MSKFNYDDTVVVVGDEKNLSYVGQTGSVIAIFESRPNKKYFEKFPEGVIYSIEFNDGKAIDIHESNLKLK